MSREFKETADRVGLSRFHPGRIVIVATLVLLVVAMSIAYMTVSSEIAARKRLVEATEDTKVQAISLFLAREIDNLSSDLHVVSGYEDYYALFESDGQAGREDLAGEFLTISQSKGIYDQVRYLDVEGQEVIRVNYNDGKQALVPDEDLQNKKGRYYFDDTFNLSRGEVFVSPLDLNIENGEIEQPLKPMIRVGEPVFDRAGNKRGIVLLNYLAGNVLDDLDEFFPIGGRECFWPTMTVTG